MARNQLRSKRKVSGKKYIAGRKGRLSELGGDLALTHIGDTRVKVKRTMGGNSKKQLLSENVVMIANGSEVIKGNIESVISNPANINFTRRNIITKGCVVKTDKGEVVITSRPGQSATLYGKLQ